MTKQDLMRILEHMPDDAVICNIHDGTITPFEITSVEFMHEESYVDGDDEAQVGDIIIM